VKEVFWIPESVPGHGGRLAIVLRPRGGEWLSDELLRLKGVGIQILVSMLEPWEADALGLTEEKALTEETGLQFFSYPIPDRTTPSDKARFHRFIDKLVAHLRAGKAIGVHCRGCIGRSTIVVACALIHLGWNAKDALNAIESARGCLVPDTQEQRDWILRYEVQR
jgi:protein-tyrosine phosphatase